MKNPPAKPKIALLGMSIMGGGTRNNGIPVLVDLFSRLSASYEITFYSFQRVHLENVPSSIKVRQVTSMRIPGRLKYFVLILRLAWDHFFRAYDLFFSVSAYPPGKAAVTLGRIFRTPAVVQIIALEAVDLPKIKSGNLTIPWLAKITRDVCARTNYLVAVSDYQAQVAREQLPTTRRIDVLPLRIDVKRFPFVKREIQFPVQFIHIAYYSPVKDQDTMFRAFAKVSAKIDCHLTVVGSGYENKELQALLSSLGISSKVSFKGFLLQSEIPDVFRGAHILLHTARFETGCAVIQEAMASGVAVAGTRVGLLSDIGDDFAVIVPPENDRELAEQLIRLINDPQLFRTITKNASRWILTHDAAWSAGNYSSFIDGILHSPRRAD